MQKNSLHQAILSVLSQQPEGMMKDTEICARIGVLPALGIKALFDLREEANPLIERVELEGGVTASRLIADESVLAIASSNAADNAVTSITAAAPAPVAVSAPVIAQAPAISSTGPTSVLASNDAGAPDGQSLIQLPEINGYTFGVNRLTDDVLREIKVSPKLANDIIVTLEAKPEDFLLAVRELEKKGLIFGTEVEIGSDTDTVFTITEDLQSEILAALQNEFEYEGTVLASEPAPVAAAPVIGSTSVIFPGATAAGGEARSALLPQQKPQAEEAIVHTLENGTQSISPGRIETQIHVPGQKLGAVALREERQRKDTIERITKLLTENQAMSKTELSDLVVDSFTVRGLKDLLKDLIDDGTLVEFRDGKTKLIKLGAGLKPVAKVAAQPVSPAAPMLAAQQPVEEPEAIEASQPYAAKPVQAATKQQEPVSLAEVIRRQDVERPSPVVEPKVSLEVSGEASVADVLMQMAERVRFLEAENKVYRDLFQHLKLPKDAIKKLMTH